MNNEILVSVCVITYNHEKYIRHALDSILNQKTNFKFEVIIHDDASTDNTQSILKEYKKLYPDIITTILQTENQHSKGVKFTNSIILPLTKGKYYAFCEGDDFWCDEFKLQKQVDYLENHPEIATVAARNYIVDENENIIRVSHKNETLNRLFDKDDIIRLGQSTLHPSTIMVRMSLRKSRDCLDGVKKCCTLGGHTFMIYYYANISPIYIFDDIMSSWRNVITPKGTSYQSRSARHPITYTMELLKMYMAYREFFGTSYDFSKRITTLFIEILIYIITKKEQNVSKPKIIGEWLKLMTFTDFCNIMKHCINGVLKKCRIKKGEA